MRKIKTQSDAKGYKDLKSRPNTLREAMNKRLPPRTVQHIRHAHLLKGIREIPRVAWEEWEPIVAQTLRALERQRYEKANRYYHAVQRIETLLGAMRRRRTELEATAEQLEKTSTYLQTLMDTMRDTVVTTDPAGIVTAVNQASEVLSGYREEERVGQPFHQFFTEAERAKAGIEETLTQGSITNYRLILRAKDGREVPMAYTAAALRDAEGNITGLVINGRDITERIQAEEVLKRQTEELQRSNAELEQFAYVASHDLREPLRKIQTFADRLQLTASASLDPQTKDYLERMHEAAGRMQILINDLLAFSRLTTRAQPFAQVDLNRVVQEVLSDLEVAIERTQGKVEVGPLPSLEADPTQMHQLFLNLVSNSLKFHRPEMPPLVRVQGKVLRRWSRNPWEREMCQVTVEDNGIGFEEKYLDRIFTIFQRLHGRGEYEGTGMGLAICRKIVDRHHGQITARSQPGQGATFLITLPIVHPPEELFTSTPEEGVGADGR